MAGDIFQWPEVLVLGASMVQRGYSEDGCWLSMLTNQLVRKCDVVNRGFSGYNTRWNKIILPRLLTKEHAGNIVCAIVLLGANDSVLKELNPAQHVPIGEYKENLISIVNQFESVGVERGNVVLIAPPPVDEEKYTLYCQETDRSMSKRQSETKKYAEACGQAAVESGVECVDLFTQMTKTDDWKRFLSDGLHFSREGSEFLFNSILPAVEKRTQHLPVILPDWKDVNPAHPEQSFR